MLQESDGALGDAGTSAADRYLDLMKLCLTRYLFIDEEVREIHPRGRWREKIYTPVLKQLGTRGMRIVKTGGDRTARELGQDWPIEAETMIGLARLDNIQRCVTDVLRRAVPGDLIETGVWRGGATIFMRAVLAAYGDTGRSVWLADSFQGLPPPNTADYPADDGLDFYLSPELSVGVDRVKANFARYGLLDDQVRFLPGWFKDTLPTAPIDQFAVIRLDGDLYESTMDALTALYPKLSVGGYLIVDDYNEIEACKAAVNDYRSGRDITETIEVVDESCVYWQRQH